MAPRDGTESEEEFQVEEFKNRIHSTRRNQFALVQHELRLDRYRRFPSKENVLRGLRGFSKGFVISPENKWYHMWTWFILALAVYSSFLTPLEFGFFRGLPDHPVILVFLDAASQVVFLLDILLHFFLAYRDGQTYKMVYNRSSIALRYLKSSFLVDILGCLPWDAIYKVSGRKEELRFLLWVRLSRFHKVTVFFQKMEKDIRINYLFTRIVKLIIVELYCTHAAACLFYYLATTLPPSEEGYTWIGSLKLGNYSYEHFRDIDLHTRYWTSLYFAIVTMATVGHYPSMQLSGFATTKWCVREEELAHYGIDLDTPH